MDFKIYFLDETDNYFGVFRMDDEEFVKSVVEDDEIYYGDYLCS